MTRRSAVYGALAGGILVVSTAAILIRTAQAEGASSLTIAALRLAIASAILLPVAWVKSAKELRALSVGDWSLALLSGASLAVHFASWITSLEHTSVASSTALVTTNPIWVGIASVLLLRERLTRNMVAGLACALAGTALMFAVDALSKAPAQVNSLLGNGLAVLGALSASAYLIIGRLLRERISLIAYVGIAYSTAAVLLVGAAMAQGQALVGLSPTAYWCMLALALGPQLLGHTLLNWSVRHVSATLVALSILGEPVGSSILAWWWLDEGFSPAQCAAFALILLGIYFGARGAGNQNAS
jgi:drug/metabolite transporter (DMT)-like permease